MAINSVVTCGISSLDSILIEREEERISSMSDFDYVIANNVHVAITRKAIKNLAYGRYANPKTGAPYTNGGAYNETARDILIGANTPICIEDFEQEVSAYLYETWREGLWYYDRESNEIISCCEENIVYKCMGVVSRLMYSFKKSYVSKREYITTYDEDGNELNLLANVPNLASVVDIDNVSSMLLNVELLKSLTTNQILWLGYRLQGMSNKDISLTMGLTSKKVRDIEKRVRVISSKVLDVVEDNYRKARVETSYITDKALALLLRLSYLVKTDIMSFELYQYCVELLEKDNYNEELVIRVYNKSFTPEAIEAAKKQAMIK